MSDIEKTRQEALELIEQCTREMQEAMRVEKPELAAAFGAMATTAGIAFLLGLHKPSEPSTAPVAECRSPYCECEAGKCTHGRIDKRGEPVRSREQHIALREAHEITASEGYFSARPWIDGGFVSRGIFNMGFIRGFDAAAEIYRTPAAPATKGETT
jgi:hypothetical protein